MLGNIGVTHTMVESDRCKQKVNKHQLAELEAYFGPKMVLMHIDILFVYI